MPPLRSRLYLAAMVGLALFAALVLLDVMRPGLLTGGLSLAVSLGLALCGVAVIALRPRKKRIAPHDQPPRDFTAVLEERRRLTEAAAKRPPRLPPGI